MIRIASILPIVLALGCTFNIDQPEPEPDREDTSTSDIGASSVAAGDASGTSGSSGMPDESSEGAETTGTMGCVSDPATGVCLCDGVPSDPYECVCEVEPTATEGFGVCVCNGGGPSHPAFCDCFVRDDGSCSCFGVEWGDETCACIPGIEYPEGPECPDRE